MIALTQAPYSLGFCFHRTTSPASAWLDPIQPTRIIGKNFSLNGIRGVEIVPHMLAFDNMRVGFDNIHLHCCGRHTILWQALPNLCSAVQQQKLRVSHLTSEENSYSGNQIKNRNFGSLGVSLLDNIRKSDLNENSIHLRSMLFRRASAEDSRLSSKIILGSDPAISLQRRARRMTHE